MKYCLLLICIFLTAVSTAQYNINFYTQAGTNYTKVRIPKTPGIETTDGKFGWQVGFGTEYHTTFGYFVYLGAGVIKESYGKDSTSKALPDTVSHFEYHPLFINFPLGIGWQFPLAKELSLKLYVGLNMQVGVSGKASKHNLYYKYDSGRQKNILMRTDGSEHDLRFGRASTRANSYDYANTNWGAQLGAGINLKNSFELSVFYHHGFTNFLPGRDAVDEINKLSYFELDARIYLPNSYFRNKKEKEGY